MLRCLKITGQVKELGKKILIQFYYVSSPCDTHMLIISDYPNIPLYPNCYYYTKLWAMRVEATKRYGSRVA